MGLATPFYKIAWSVRQGPLGEGLAKTWHKLAPSIDIWKKIYGFDVCVDFRDSLIWWAVDPAGIKEAEGFHTMLAGIKGNVWDVGCNVGVFSLYAASQGKAGMPFEVSFIHQQTISGSGGNQPKYFVDQIQIRVYRKLFGASGKKTRALGPI